MLRIIYLGSLVNGVRGMSMWDLVKDSVIKAKWDNKNRIKQACEHRIDQLELLKASNIWPVEQDYPSLEVKKEMIAHVKKEICNSEENVGMHFPAGFGTSAFSVGLYKSFDRGLRESMIENSVPEDDGKRTRHVRVVQTESELLTLVKMILARAVHHFEGRDVLESIEGSKEQVNDSDDVSDEVTDLYEIIQGVQSKKEKKLLNKYKALVMKKLLDEPAKLLNDENELHKTTPNEEAKEEDDLASENGCLTDANFNTIDEELKEMGIKSGKNGVNEGKEPQNLLKTLHGFRVENSPGPETTRDDVAAATQQEIVNGSIDEGSSKLSPIQEAHGHSAKNDIFKDEDDGLIKAESDEPLAVSEEGPISKDQVAGDGKKNTEGFQQEKDSEENTIEWSLKTQLYLAGCIVGIGVLTVLLIICSVTGALHCRRGGAEVAEEEFEDSDGDSSGAENCETALMTESVYGSC